jgi:hypothetical protein
MRIKRRKGDYRTNNKESWTDKGDDEDVNPMSAPLSS